MTCFAFERSSPLAVTPDAFWTGASLAEVNRELSPWVRMTAPAEWLRRPLHAWPTGTPLFSSWVLLFGVIPVDRHHFCLQSATPGVGFEERSSSAMNRHWNHTRSVRPQPGGSLLVDRVEYVPRNAVLGALLLPVYKLIFAGRHRTLRHQHGHPAGMP